MLAAHSQLFRKAAQGSNPIGACGACRHGLDELSCAVVQMLFRMGSVLHPASTVLSLLVLSDNVFPQGRHSLSSLQRNVPSDRLDVDFIGGVPKCLPRAEMCAHHT